MNLPHAAPFECRRHRLEEVLDTAPNPLLERTLKLSHVNVQTDLRAIAAFPVFSEENRVLFVSKLSPAANSS